MLHYSALGFVLSALIQLSTLAGINTLVDTDMLYLLHVAVFPPFIAMVKSAAKKWTSFGVEDLVQAVFGSVPKPALIALAGLGVYTMVNFFLASINLLEGSPYRDNGVFVLKNHGHYVRDLTQQEYLDLKRTELRSFSGFWCFFYAMPYLYFKYLACRK